MEEQSRIIQLEEELGLRKAEIQKLQARLGGADAQSESVSREPMKESGELGEQVESLKVALESKNQEISEMKLKIQQVSRENMEMMDMWKVSALLLPDFRERWRRKASLLPPAGRLRLSLGQIWFFSPLFHQIHLVYSDKLLPPQAKFETLVSDHQRSMEELKVTLNSSSATPAGQEPDAQELKATLEALKMEHQLEMENLKAKHKIEAALQTKEREDLSTRLQELKEQLADPHQARRSEPEARSGNHALEEVSEKLQKAERRAAEAEQVEAELRQKLELSEKKMVDYESLQKAQRESQEEIQKLEEKLRVTANQLQANVRTDQSGGSFECGRPSNGSSLLQVIEDNEVSEEKMKLKQSVEGIVMVTGAAACTREGAELPGRGRSHQGRSR